MKPIAAFEKLERACHYQVNQEIEPEEAQAILQYVEQLESKVARQPEWISVDDKMPDSGVEVLIADDLGNVNIGFYDDDFYDAGWAILSGAKRFVPISKSRITHWVPLPEPPEKEQK